MIICNECYLNFSSICFSRLWCREITVLILLLASCRANQTAMDYCGDGNTCLGSISSYVCVCEAPGWKLNTSNYKECMEGTISFSLFSWISFFSKNPTNTSHVFYVETTWKRMFPRHFNVEYTCCICWQYTCPNLAIKN